MKSREPLWKLLSKSKGWWKTSLILNPFNFSIKSSNDIGQEVDGLRPGKLSWKEFLIKEYFSKLALVWKSIY